MSNQPGTMVIFLDIDLSLEGLNFLKILLSQVCVQLFIKNFYVEKQNSWNHSD
jgi:hypothetical protein